MPLAQLIVDPRLATTLMPACEGESSMQEQRRSCKGPCFRPNLAYKGRDQSSDLQQRPTPTERHFTLLNSCVQNHVGDGMFALESQYASTCASVSQLPYSRRIWAALLCHGGNSPKRGMAIEVRWEDVTPHWYSPSRLKLWANHNTGIKLRPHRARIDSQAPVVGFFTGNGATGPGPVLHCGLLSHLPGRRRSKGTAMDHHAPLADVRWEGV